jgi:hypothetical protein
MRELIRHQFLVIALCHRSYLRVGQISGVLSCDDATQCQDAEKMT